MRKVKVSYAITHAILKVGTTRSDEATTNAVNSAIEKDEKLHSRKIFLLLVWYVQFCRFQVIVSLHLFSRLLESFIPLAAYIFFSCNHQKQPETIYK